MPQLSLTLAICGLLLAPATMLAEESRRPREPLLQQALRVAPPLAAPRELQQRSGDGLAQRQSKRTPVKRILGAAVGGVGGFFAGGYMGAWIEGDRCHCDDPGLKGAIIGSLTGATAGGILGGLYLF